MGLFLSSILLQATPIIETIDAPHQFTEMGDHSIALDSSGNAHIAYGEDGLYHNWYDGSQWQIETVDATGDV